MVDEAKIIEIVRRKWLRGLKWVKLNGSIFYMVELVKMKWLSWLKEMVELVERNG